MPELRITTQDMAQFQITLTSSGNQFSISLTTRIAKLAELHRIQRQIKL